MFGKYTLSVCKRLRQVRRELDLSQEKFAESVGISASVVSKYESFNRAPSVDLIYRVMVTYGISTDWLFGRSEVKYIEQEGMDDKSVDVA